jgi:hypothetical protein
MATNRCAVAISTSTTPVTGAEDECNRDTFYKFTQIVAFHAGVEFAIDYSTINYCLLTYHALAPAASTLSTAEMDYKVHAPVLLDANLMSRIKTACQHKYLSVRTERKQRKGRVAYINDEIYDPSEFKVMRVVWKVPVLEHTQNDYTRVTRQYDAEFTFATGASFIDFIIAACLRVTNIDFLDIRIQSLVSCCAGGRCINKHTTPSVRYCNIHNDGSAHMAKRPRVE